MSEENQQTDNHQPADDSQNGNITLEKLQTDLDSAMNGWKRAAADFENYKRRKEAENRELLEFAKEVTVVKLLPTIDSLEQALKHLPEYTPTTPSRQGGTPLLEKEGSSAENAEISAEPLPLAEGEYRPQGGEGVRAEEFRKKYANWQMGVDGIVMQLDKALGELGVRKIEAIGKKFDPNFHEAIRETESDQDDGIIIEEVQTGFELNGKVIRPSQVVISKKKLE